MPKQCNAEGCGYNQFGGGFCKNHQYLRTDKKPKAIRKVSSKQKVKNEQDAEDTNKMHQVFMEIWNKRPHVSQLSGKPLGREPKTYMFDHLLEKSVFEEIKFEEWNIILVTDDEHTLKTNGFPLPAHQELIEKARIHYQNHYKNDNTV